MSTQSSVRNTSRAGNIKRKKARTLQWRTCLSLLKLAMEIEIATY